MDEKHWFDFQVMAGLGYKTVLRPEQMKELVDEIKRLREQCHEPTLTCPDCGRVFPWDETEHYCMGTLRDDRVFGLQQVVKPR